MLASLRSEPGAAEETRRLWPLLESLYPICRSITGDGVRKTLDLVGEWIPLDRTEVPTGTRVFDWEVPSEWNIRDAYIADDEGRRIVDFRAHSLHVVSYSVPVDRRMTREEIEPHLYSLPERPDWIPYRTSYYREHWGFCLRHRDRANLGPGPFHAVINSTLAPGSLTYAECVVLGTSSEEAIIYTHTCHPSLANDNLTGIGAAAVLARQLLQEHPRLTWRFVFGPGTIGSLAWLSRNEDRVGRIAAGLTIGLLGDPGPLTFKRSRQGDSVTDRAAVYVLGRLPAASRIVDFEPYGYDERQFCSPGFESSRRPAYAQPERRVPRVPYLRRQPGLHSSGLSGRVHPRLGRPHHGARRQSPDAQSEPEGGAAARQARPVFEAWAVLPPAISSMPCSGSSGYSDGKHDLLAIAQRSGIDFDVLVQAAAALESAGLLRPVGDDESVKGGKP